jgi:hypothetical protein
MNQRISESASGNSELIGSLGPAPLTAPANPQFHLIPLNSTWFHLIPLPVPTGPDHPMHYQSAIHIRMTFSRKEAQDAQIALSPFAPFAPFRGQPAIRNSFFSPSNNAQSR